MVVLITPLGFRWVIKSVAAIKAARTQATVVKKPKTFWMRVKELCIVDGGARQAGTTQLTDRRRTSEREEQQQQQQWMVWKAGWLLEMAWVVR